MPNNCLHNFDHGYYNSKGSKLGHEGTYLAMFKCVNCALCIDMKTNYTEYTKLKLTL